MKSHSRLEARLGAIVKDVQDRFDQPTTRPLSPDAWFLGGHAENEALLRALLSEVIDGHVSNRRAYARDDPDFLYEDDYDSEEFARTKDLLLQNLRGLNDKLKGSIPVASYRNQSHMYWDVTLPGVAGYIAGMLHNQNQAAAEGSPVTTALEYAVGQQLCDMLGYDVTGATKPWGHITVGGTIANVEAVWAARNLRFQAVALAHALRVDPAFADAANITLRTADGRRARMASLSDWDLLNIPVDDALDLPQRFTRTCGIPERAVKAALDRFSVQQMGLLDFYRTMLPDTPAPAMIVPATAHYSWPRGAGISGLGIRHMLPVAVDLDGRMDMVALRHVLDNCLSEKRPVVMVVAVIGSTRESAVDPIAEIADIRDEYREMGLDFVIHADAAWGGYFRSMVKPPKFLGADSPQSRLSDYVGHQFAALPRADSITVDPHKAGFIPYPAGALCYRNGAMPGLITVVADVVYHGGSAMTMGACALAGSSPGASTTAVYLSHLCIPPDKSGYGKLLGRCVHNAKRFYAALVTMARADDPFVIVPFKRIPAEAAGKTAVEQREELALIEERIVGLSEEVLKEQLDHDPDLAALFEALGPDLTVINYAFNFRTADGLNTDPALMNELNLAIFRACSIEENETYEVPRQELILTQAAFDPEVYGQEFCNIFARRLGVDPQDGVPVDYLISTMQNAWITNTSVGNFIPELIGALRGIVTREVQALVHRHGLPPLQEKKG